MKIVVGLGNPGSRYEGTRHNIGFEVLSELNRRWSGGKPRVRFEAEVVEISVNGGKVVLVAPQTFMNLSGRSVQQIVHFFQTSLADVLVVCDDLNLKVGQLRLRAAGSSGGQKGLQSILTCMGNQSIARLRLGIGRPPASIDPADYVLGKFRKDELPLVDKVVHRAASAVETWITDGIASAMNVFNAELSGGDTDLVSED